jgi:hypothetical protein
MDSEELCQSTHVPGRDGEVPEDDGQVGYPSMQGQLFAVDKT